ncbi:MAG TPA: hypothetical protein DCZ94_10285 [Lentisphaeria bacterium]|nr:MAG: hypothetical protein A2X48_11160 [Lentisphaerae bacterium GWF2_49_21]HBC87332.1 hypothetical protein [Lentisphaeria bacterium]
MPGVHQIPFSQPRLRRLADERALRMEIIEFGIDCNFDEQSESVECGSEMKRRYRLSSAKRCFAGNKAESIASALQGQGV